MKWQVWLFKILIFGMIGVLFGIVLAKVSNVAVANILGFAVLAIFLSVWLRPLFFVSVALFGAVIGVARSEPLIKGYDFLDQLQGQEISVLGTISTDPVYHESGQFEFNIENLNVQNQEIQAILRVRGYVNDVRRGDGVVVSGKLRDGFAYWQGSLYFAEIEVRSRSNGGLAEFRREFIANTYSTIPDPEGSLGLGFLIGVRSLLPDSLVDQLSITGLTHIVAVSGYNLTIMVGLSRRLFLKWSRIWALLFSALFIFGFVSITGISPSILRAVIVSGVSLFAWFYGRNVNPWALLLYSSAISALINPAYVWFDIGWYLSLLAFFGVLILAPLLHKRIYGEKKPKLIGQIAVETGCAQLMTMPLIMFVFGDVSLVAMLANLLVLPLIPFAMILSALTGMLYFFSWQVAAIAAIPAYLLLSFIVQLISLMAKIDWALIRAPISELQMISLYSISLLMVWVLHRRLDIKQFAILRSTDTKEQWE